MRRATRRGWWRAVGMRGMARMLLREARLWRDRGRPDLESRFRKNAEGWRAAARKAERRMANPSLRASPRSLVEVVR